MQKAEPFTCIHGNPVRPGEIFTDDQCRVCWLAVGGSVDAPTGERGPCRFRGDPTGEAILCPTCSGVVRLKVFRCDKTPTGCTLKKKVDEKWCCNGCHEYEARPESKTEVVGIGVTKVNRKDVEKQPVGIVVKGNIRRTPFVWSYGITTVPERRNNLFRRTLESLGKAGFDTPHVFVDRSYADPDGTSWRKEFGLEVTIRGGDPVRTAGHWILSLYELYVRNPQADRFALFQDDFVTYKNLRQYLDKCQYPERGYLNLYTFPANQAIAEREGVRVGWYKSNQFGRGAVALVFDRDAVHALLSSRHMAERPMDRHRGWKAVDGGIVTSLIKEGISEYVHTPSLTQHTGDESSMGNLPHLKANTFRGEDFDALSLLDSPDTAKVG